MIFRIDSETTRDTANAVYIREDLMKNQEAVTSYCSSFDTGLVNKLFEAPVGDL